MPALAASPEPAAPAAAPLRVLLADDDPQIGDIVTLYFARHGDAAVTVVHSGTACLAALARDSYDLVLLDLSMPDLDGLQILGTLTARGDATPVIMVSGDGQSPLAVRAMRAGAVDCIDKNSADFHRIAEIAHRTHAHRRRVHTHFAPSVATRRVLGLEPRPAEQAALAQFFRAHAPHLAFTAIDPAALDAALGTSEPALGGPPPFDAVLFGPGLAPAAMLDLLRRLRSRLPATPMLVLAHTGEAAIAAFKLGAHDYLIRGADALPELVFSLNQALRHAESERLNLRLTDELAALNRSLADQVAARTRELEQENGERRAAEERARGLATRLLRAREDERRALARDLHDQVGQLLTGLRFQIEAARPAAPALAATLALTDELLATVRELTLRLHPRILDDLGLGAALDWHTRRFTRQTGIEVALEVQLPDARLDPDLETVAYRIVQEALTNVARHSGAPAAAVTVAADSATLHLEISDRGRGCDAAAALATHDSLGLAGIAERVRLANGRFDFVSAPGQGTRLHVEFPLPPNLSLSS
jgi:signal transduction histidine kinase